MEAGSTNGASVLPYRKNRYDMSYLFFGKKSNVKRKINDLFESTLLLAIS